MSPPPTRVTLRDVAKAANVSLGTASNAFSGRVRTSDELRDHIFAVAAALGYQHRGRGTGSQTLRVIGAIGKASQGELMSSNPFYSHVLAGIEQACQREHISLMLANIEVDRRNRPVSLPPMLLEDRVDGVLMIGTFLRDTIQQVTAGLERPLVLVDAYAPGSRFDSVLIDNLNGAAHAVDYLYRRGHRHIGIVGSAPDGYPSIRERRKGCLRALKARHLSDLYLEDSPLTRDGGLQAGKSLLLRAPQVTAIFACNDDVADGVLEAAAQLGRDVPSTLSVIGFDDIDLASALRPALTTMRVDKRLMGRLAVRLLQERAAEPGRPPLTVQIGTELIVRDSVRSLRRPR
jgi:DNA-binding LacI/PurR family transcriptional regulator